MRLLLPAALIIGSLVTPASLRAEIVRHWLAGQSNGRIVQELASCQELNFPSHKKTGIPLAADPTWEGSALRFSDATAAVSRAQAQPSRMPQSGAIELWYKPDGGAFDGEAVLYCTMLPAARGTGHALARRGDGALAFTNAATQASVRTDALAWDDRWYHIAVTWQSVEDDKYRVTLYRDGVALKNEAKADLQIFELEMIGEVVGNSVTLLNAAQQDVSANARGAIDEVRLHDAELTAADVKKSIANAPHPPQDGWCTGLVRFKGRQDHRDLIIVAAKHIVSGAVIERQAVTDQCGQFFLDRLPAGTYQMTVYRPVYLRKSVGGVKVTNDGGSVDFGELEVGDFNGDNKVDFNDLPYLSGSHGKLGAERLE